MLSAEFRKPSAEMSHRPSVRIVRRRLPSRTATISLTITAVAAGCAFVAWRLWSADAAVTPYQRSLGDVLLTYRCARGDTFQARGQSTPINCPNCGRPAHPVTTFACDSHHVHEALVRFTVGSDGEPAVDQFRLLPNGEWTKVGETLKCPRCGGPLKRMPEEVIDFDRLRPREPDGGLKRLAPSPTPEWPRADSPPERPLPDVKP